MDKRVRKKHNGIKIKSIFKKTCSLIFILMLLLILKDNMVEAIENRPFDYDSPEYRNISDAVVSDGAPLMTVITAGLSGRPHNWSNDGTKENKFAYSEDSIVTRLANMTDANVYLAKIAENNSYYLAY